MKRFKFIENPKLFNDSSAFVAHIERVNGEKDLLHQIAKQLNFPSYFGQNWDALLDCLRNFEWIEQYKIILIHNDLVQLNIHDFHTYLEILLESINDWAAGEDHEFEVIFSSEYEDLIRPYEEKYWVELEKFLKRES